jgi:hypothetical protein
MDLVRRAENELGWQPITSKLNIYRARAAAAVRLEKAMAANECTVEDIALAINYCKRKRIYIQQPSALVIHVDAARECAVEPEESTYADDAGRAITAALDWESQTLRDGHTYWVHRLVRSVGDGRADTLREWKEAGRGDG